MATKKPWLNKNTNLLNFAVQIAATGQAVFPCHPGTKAPLTPHGFKDASLNADQISEWWGRYPNAWIASPTGNESHRLVIDLDRKPGQADGVIEWPKFLSDNGIDEIETKTIQTPSGGRHLVFNCDEDLGSLPLNKLWPGIEVKSNGGYVIVPPSPGYSVLSDVEPIEAPQWLVNRIGELKRSNGHFHGDDDGTASIEELKLAMDVIPNDDLVWDDWNRVAMALWRASTGSAEAFKLFDEWSKKSSKYNTRICRDRWRVIGRSRPTELGAGTLFYLAQEADPFWREAGRNAEHEEQAAKLVEGLLRGRNKGEKSSHEFQEFPDRLLQVPGVVSEIADWVLSCSRRPQPLLALAVGLCVVGTCIGRKVAGPTHSGTHLYMTFVSPTGSGKQLAVDAIAEIFSACGPPIKACCGPPEFSSISAFTHFLEKQPLAICVFDEIGSFLKRILNRRASGWEAGISAELRRAWGSSFSEMRTTEWAQISSKIISSPALTVLGASTQKEFYDSLRGEDVGNGLLNRFLILETQLTPQPQNPDHSIRQVPKPIVAKLRRLYDRGSALYVEKVAPSQIIDETDEAYGLRLAFTQEIEARSRKHPDQADFLVRAVENALRLATIVAAGDSANAISGPTMAWAIDFSRWASDRLIQAARAHIADSETQEMAQQIRRIILRHGKPGDPWVKMATLWRGLKFKYKRRDVEEVIRMLTESREVVVKKSQPKGGGTPTHWFKIQDQTAIDIDAAEGSV